MTKQEFLAMSLPYRVKILWRDDEIVILQPRNICFIFDNDEYTKPILHPLSDLTKEIEHKGKKFVPIVKIAEILGYENISLKGNDCQVGLIESGSSYIKETLRYTDNYFYIDVEDYYYSSDSAKRYKDGIFMDHFQLFQKLIEWHFDIADLISKGEAIDVNTLEENLYK